MKQNVLMSLTIEQSSFFLKLFKHLRSYRDGSYLKLWCFDECAATQKSHAADTKHDTPPCHSIQTQGDLSLCYPSLTLHTHTPANAQLYDAGMVVVSRKLGRKYRTNQVLNPGPVVCKSLSISAHPQLLHEQSFLTRIRVCMCVCVRVYVRLCACVCACV